MSVDLDAQHRSLMRKQANWNAVLERSWMHRQSADKARAELEELKQRDPTLYEADAPRRLEKIAYHEARANELRVEADKMNAHILAEWRERPEHKLPTDARLSASNVLEEARARSHSHSREDRERD